MNKLLGYVNYKDTHHLKELLKENGIDIEYYNTDSVWDDARIYTDNIEDVEVRVYGTDYVIVQNTKLIGLVEQIEKVTNFAATLVNDGLFINHKKGDHSNDYSLTIEDYKNTKIRVANSSTIEYFDNIDDAGDYLIEQLSFN
jgi:hypothetical protein